MPPHHTSKSNGFINSIISKPANIYAFWYHSFEAKMDQLLEMKQVEIEMNSTLLSLMLRPINSLVEEEKKAERHQIENIK